MIDVFSVLLKKLRRSYVLLEESYGIRYLNKRIFERYQRKKNIKEKLIKLYFFNKAILIITDSFHVDVRYDTCVDRRQRDDRSVDLRKTDYSTEPCYTWPRSPA